MRQRPIAIIGFALLASSLLGLLFQAGIVSGSTGAPLCTDVRQNPVIQDSGWNRDNFSGIWTYSTIHDYISVINQGPGFVSFISESVNGTQGIYRGTSSDGMAWSLSTSPVLPLGANGTWDDGAVYSTSVLWNGTGYLMYYTGSGTGAFREIGVAFSTDSMHWTRYSGNPVIVHGPGDYDSRYTRSPSVIFDGGIYKMWYAAEASQGSTYPLRQAIAYATSSDGVHWTKYAQNPVFLGFSYGGETVAARPTVVKVNGTYFMAFDENGAGPFGYATSTDGVGWRFSNNTNVLLNTNGWHNSTSYGVNAPSILVDDSRLLLWYSGIQSLSNQSTPIEEGIGFARCGALFIAPPGTTTASTTAVSVLSSTQTRTQTITSVASTVQTTSLGAAGTTLQFAGAFAGGFAVAAAVASLIVWRRMRGK